MRSTSLILILFGILFLQLNLAQNLRENGAVPILAKSVFGGLIPDYEFQYASALVDVILYSNGNLVFTTYDAISNNRLVKIGHVSTKQVTNIQVLATNANIDKWQPSYSDPNAPTDGPSTCIRYWPTGQTEFISVCQYYGGAPAEFNKIVSLLEDMKFNAINTQSSTLKEYKPIKGWLQTFTTTCEWQRECSTRDYSWGLSANAPSLSNALTTPVEITEDLLQKAWDAQNKGGVVFYYRSNWYKPTVVVDDLSLKSPPTSSQTPSTNPPPYTDPPPKPYSRISSVTLGLIIGGGALGVLILISVVCCMIRRQRRLNQQRRGIDAVPLTSSSDWSSTNRVTSTVAPTSTNNFSSSYLQTSYSQPTAPYVQTNDPSGSSFSMPTVIYTLPTQSPNIMYTQPGSGSSYYFVPVQTINPQQTN